ncbi:hypothetical protein D3C75_1032210 [compost metagenome]
MAEQEYGQITGADDQHKLRIVPADEKQAEQQAGQQLMENAQIEGMKDVFPRLGAIVDELD